MCQMRKKGDTPGNIAKHFEIKSSSTVSTILGQSAKIISEFEKNSNENDMVRNKTSMPNTLVFDITKSDITSSSFSNRAPRCIEV